jgi:hypothetical protein
VTSRRASRSSLSHLFLGTHYDSATTCAVTAGRARQLGLSVGFGPRGADVDTRDDLDSLARQLERAPTSILTRTRSALALVHAEPAAAAGS